MKYSKNFLCVLFFCLSFNFMFGEGRIIEQRIVKNIDGTNSDFLFFYTNTTDLTFHVQAFHTNNHHLILSTEQNDVDFGVFKFPAKVYAVSRGSYFIDFDIFSWSGVTKKIQEQTPPMVLSWEIHNQDNNPWLYSIRIYLAVLIDSNMDFFHKNQKDGIFAEIIKLMDGNNLSFALLFANHTSKKIVLTDLYGDGNQVKLKFPNGRVFTPPFKKDAKNMELNPGESKTFKIELDQLLKENKDFSMKDFEFGLTELVWEMKLDKEHAITRNFWLVKFNGELPEAHADSGYKLDGPLTLETFRDKKISALPAPQAYFGNKDVESATKETPGNKESSQK